MLVMGILLGIYVHELGARLSLATCVAVYLCTYS